MNMSNNPTRITKSLINNSENQTIDYRTEIERKSENILEIEDDYKIFLSHACDGEGAHTDEKNFVLSLYELLKKEYDNKVYLDLICNSSYQISPIISAAQLSKYGVFICSPRFIKIALGKRKEPFLKEYDIITKELDVFHNKERELGFRIIPVRFGVTDEAYRKKGPFGSRFLISIENEASKTYLIKASIVANKIIEKITEIEKINK